MSLKFEMISFEVIAFPPWNIWPVCWYFLFVSTDDWHHWLSMTSWPKRCTVLPSFSWSFPIDRRNPWLNCCSQTWPCSMTMPTRYRVKVWNLFVDDFSGFCWRNSVCKSSNKTSLRLWWVLKWNTAQLDYNNLGYNKLGCNEQKKRICTSHIMVFFPGYNEQNYTKNKYFILFT